MKNVREPANIPDFVLDHVRLYLKTNGADGYLWDSTGFGDHGMLPTLLLTSIGCKSGEPMMVPLIYGEANGNYIVCASRGGAPVNPAWCLNLQANPTVEVQVIANKFSATARLAVGEERQQLWKLMAGIYPTYDDLQASTKREIPIIVLTPIAD
ncbi:MAG: deazaflavin-dependent oxidoreductase (nitroreductase family) [Gammaproteobacteria bacterium]|jgi:deazaflavin-dependent oxidoreductase (nitroreductase family)